MMLVTTTAGLTATAALTHLTCEAAVGLVKGCTRLVSAAALSTAHPSTVDVKAVLEETDIINRIKVVQAYLLEVKASRWLRDRESIRLATEGVKHAIEQLQSSVDAIHGEIELHATRYFASWRTPDVERHVAGIRVWSTRLDDRMRTLREVTTLATLGEPRKDD